jgi:hypothetical protein
MDQETRNKLQRATQQIRRLLEAEFAEQLEGTFDILPNGKILSEPGKHLDARQRLTRQKLVDAIEHIKAGGKKPIEAVEEYTREAAFTFLNRFVALRMIEARELLQECVSKGDQSSGFKEFCGLAPGLSSLPDVGYRLYLECLFDELSVEVKVLFDRRDSASLLWPRRTALNELLNILAQVALAAVWTEDETIGWVYQYYNDEAERKKIREESSAPRNSRELAVRNQFFTPRYVVEFLTDNTLGRIWYEMCQGQTRLRDQCRYLVRRPNEVFLKAGEAAPELGSDQGPVATEETTDHRPLATDLSQEDLLRQPVYIPHRPLKDPREIRLLDPACGSMHFGLYAFDLFTVIYDEAWEIAHGPDDAAKPAVTFNTFAAGFPDKAAFLREVPRLIVERNLHGIDIDPRAAQIAGLSLWLRAQRAWHQAGVKPADRPRISRSNLVCAEPMPGEKKLLREFVEQQFSFEERPAFAFLLEKIFDHMSLAGEAGSLLSIEGEIRTSIAEASALAQSQSAPRQSLLFPDEEKPKQLEFDLRGLNDEEFWQEAERRIYDALEAYAKQTERGGGFQRRLFADDAAQGFAFIDLCRKRYDVVMMNPPFGDASLPSKSYIDETYGDTKGDVYTAFVECFHERLLPSGYLGIISSRTGFFLGQSEDWRTRVVLRLFRPIALADLGMGVLDAMVEVAAYVLRNLSVQEARDLTHSLVPVLETVVRDRQDRFSLPKWQAARDGLKRHQAVAELEHLEAHGFVQRCPGNIVRYAPLWDSVNSVTAPPEAVYPLLVCVRATGEADKGRTVADAVFLPGHALRFEICPTAFQSLPSAPFAYWLTPGLQRVFVNFPPFASGNRDVRQGLATADDFRFLRVWWEVDSSSLCPPEAHPPGWSGSYCVPKYRWFPICRGGKRQTFYRDLCAVIDWARHGEVVRAFSGSVVRNPDFYFRPGFSWPLRGITFSAQAVPSGSLFSVAGKLACADRKDELLPLLALANSEVCDRLITLFAGKVGGVQYEVGLLARIPIPHLDSASAERLSELAHNGWALQHRLDSADANSHAFHQTALVAVSGNTLTERAAAWATQVRTSEEAVAAIKGEIDDRAFLLYGLDTADRAALTTTLANEDPNDAEPGEVEEEEAAIEDTAALVADLLGYAFGTIFGRWDIRYATGERPAPELPDPFAPLPVCSPGMLQGDDGLPLSPKAGHRLRAEGRYPLDVAWDGILVDDPEHPHDLERRVHAALSVLWGDRADALEHEACGLLGVPTLREWFRRPAGFFAEHLKRYSKSRRRAPIYLPLSTPSSSYTVWLYYHRFSKDTFFRTREIIGEKLRYEQTKLERLKSEYGEQPTRSQTKELETQEKIASEIKAMCEEVDRIAPLWNPNLNDGVIINFAPLWRLVPHHKVWQKECKKVWDKLVQGEYDWAHLAMRLWPERVVPRCVTDASLATAHGLGEIFWVQDQRNRFQAREEPEAGWEPLIDRLVKERSSTAVKAALQSLLDATRSNN